MIFAHLFFAMYIILGIACIIAVAVASRHFIHMFQLNSYKPKVHLRWLWAYEKNYILSNAIVGAVGVLSLIGIIATVLPDGNSSSYAETFLFAFLCIVAFIAVPIVTIALSIQSIVKYNPRRRVYKTPLVYTARVKRMIATFAVLNLLAVLLFVCFAFHVIKTTFTFLAVPLFIPYAPAIALALLPLTILLANLINRPLELMINRHYINDAKRILEGCRSHLRVIGITGSFGKTSVKYFLETLLSVKYNVLKTPGNFNTPLGVVKTIRGSLRATHDIFLCEMGAKNVGDIKEICDIVHPDMGIITSVGPMHLESFKSIENVIKTKFELADAVSQKGGEVYANFDNEYIVGECKKREVIPYGIDDVSGYIVSNLHISELGSEFTVTSPEGESCEYRTRLIGKHNVLNIVGAIAVAHRLGIDLDELRPAVRKLESVPHRLQLIDKGEYTIIDDAYNSNPSGTKAALETLSMTDGMKILVTPGMVELGGMEYALNKEFGVDAAKVCDFVALVGKKQTQPIYDGLKSVDYPEEKIYVAESLNDAMAKVYGLTSGGKRKIILLENDLPDNY